MNTETLGQRIKRYRKKAGLSQAALAEACGWKSQSRVGNYESDTREPTLADLRLIAQALDVEESAIILDFVPDQAGQSSARPAPAAAPLKGLSDLQQALLAAAQGLDYGQMAELIAYAKQLGGRTYVSHIQPRQITTPDNLDKPLAALIPESAAEGIASRAMQLDQDEKPEDRRKQDHGPPGGVERRAKS